MSPLLESSELALVKSRDVIRSGGIQSGGACRCFSLEEVLTATKSFDDALVIGVGGFGKVYKGFIDNDSTKIVAVKRMNAESKQGAREFWTEVKMLSISKLRHTHLVSLLGYCNECLEMILVYEYIAHGTLASHLYSLSTTDSGKSISPLTWEQRLNICIGAARGLDYLHAGTDQCFIHRDVKTVNILLGDNWVAKISDFGLSKGPTSHSITHVSTDVKGTFGYLDPNYFLTQRLTTKSDVYAFGVVLLEVLCGRRAVDKRLGEDQIGLVQWSSHCMKKGKHDGVIDPFLSGQIAPRCLKSFVGLVSSCLRTVPKSRPTMAEVLGSLELVLKSQQKGRTDGIVTKAFQSVNRWLRERSDNGSSRGQSKDRHWESDRSSVTQLHHHSSSVGGGLRMFEGPGIDHFQIIGAAKPGFRLLGCGFPVRGTSLCMFQWVRHLQDGTKKYIEGATDPEYVVTVDDIGKLIAVECVPMDDQGRQGKLVQLFANGQKKITCDSDMQLEIDTHVSKGQAAFRILLLKDSSETWEPTTLLLKQSGYQIIDNKTQDIIIAEIFSKDLSIKIPVGLSSQFVLTWFNGSSLQLKTYNDARNRDTLVLTMRMFQSKALDERKKGRV